MASEQELEKMTTREVVDAFTGDEDSTTAGKVLMRKALGRTTLEKKDYVRRLKGNDGNPLTTGDEPLRAEDYLNHSLAIGNHYVVRRLIQFALMDEDDPRFPDLRDSMENYVMSRTLDEEE